MKESRKFLKKKTKGFFFRKSSKDDYHIVLEYLLPGFNGIRMIKLCKQNYVWTLCPLHEYRGITITQNCTELSEAIEGFLIESEMSMDDMIPNYDII